MVLDLLVTDKSGRPVPGLGPFDFTILDNQAPQKVMSFHRSEMTPEQPDSPVEVIYVLDSVDTNLNDMLYERRDFTKFLRRNGGKLAEPTTIVLLTDGDMKVQPHPSRDGNQLADALEKLPNPVHKWANAQGYAGLIVRNQFCLKSLNELAFYEATKPGRKVLIWIGREWPSLARSDGNLTNKDYQDLYDSIATLSNRLREARMTVYAIDERGPVAGENPLYYRAYLKYPATPLQSLSPDLMLGVLATHSGGRVIDIDRDLIAEIDMCLGDLAAWYTIAFDPPPAAKPNEFHSLEVKTSKEGLTVHTTQGYYGQP